MYTTIITGNTPVIISVPHDGDIILPSIPLTTEALNWLRSGHDGRDYGTTLCAYACFHAMKKLGMTPTLVNFQISRSQIDVNRDPEREPFIAKQAKHDFCKSEYEAFHAAIEGQIELCLRSSQRCLLVDLHSFENFSMRGADIVFGTKEGLLCPNDWSEDLFHSLSTYQHAMLKRVYKMTYSPDRANGLGGWLSGGYVVRRAIATFSSARSKSHLGGIQIEVRRQPFFLEHPELVGMHLAEALLCLLGKIR